MSERFKPEDNRSSDERAEDALVEIQDRLNGTAEGDFLYLSEMAVTEEEELEWLRIEQQQNKRRGRL